MKQKEITPPSDNSDSESIPDSQKKIRNIHSPVNKFQIGLNSSDRDVLEVLYSHLGPAGKIFPSWETIKFYTDLSRATIHRSLKRLERCGVIYWERGRQHHSNRYYITDPNTWRFEDGRPQRSLIETAQTSHTETTEHPDVSHRDPPVSHRDLSVVSHRDPNQYEGNLYDELGNETKELESSTIPLEAGDGKCKRCNGTHMVQIGSEGVGSFVKCDCWKPPPKKPGIIKRKEVDEYGGKTNF